MRGRVATRSVSPPSSHVVQAGRVRESLLSSLFVLEPCLVSLVTLCRPCKYIYSSLLSFLLCPRSCSCLFSFVFVIAPTSTNIHIHPHAPTFNESGNINISNNTNINKHPLHYICTHTYPTPTFLRTLSIYLCLRAPTPADPSNGAHLRRF